MRLQQQVATAGRGSAGGEADFSFPCVAARTIVGVQMSLPLGFVRTAPTTYQLPTFHAARVRLEMYMPTANQRGHGKS
jgi:hypothetical protein